MYKYALAAVVLGFAAPTLASPIQVNVFTPEGYTAAAGTSGTVVEDFEGFSEMNVGGVGTPFDTGTVGTFETLGGTGTGGTVTNFDNTFNAGNPNDGTALAIRDGDVFGRRSTTQMINPDDRGPGLFLDSNDTHGILWNVSLGGDSFNKIVFTMTDATDVGATLRIWTPLGDAVFSNLKGNLPDGQPTSRDGNIQTVEIDFETAVSTATIELENFRNRTLTENRRNDGFSIDDISVNVVPLPAAAWMLLAGIGAIGAVARRRKS